MNQIYTTGYSGHTAAQLKQAADALGALIIDIRYSPKSCRQEWNKAELEKLFGAKYFWVKALGNKNFKSGPIQLAAPASGIGYVTYLAQTRPLILVCGCRDYESCHRRTVACLLSERGIETQEMAWPAAPVVAIKALTLYQPHASLIFLPDGWRKIYETRSWPLSYRGPLVIHAAKNPGDLELCLEKPFGPALRQGGFVKIGDLPLMAAIGVVDVVDCRATGAWCDELPEPVRNFGDFGPGRYAFELANPRLFAKPLPLRGQQGLKPFGYDLEAALQGELVPLGTETSVKKANTSSEPVASQSSLF